MTASFHDRNRPRIAFVDPCSARGYDPSNLLAGGLGGTEATVLRVAAALSRSFSIEIYQNGRTDKVNSRAGALKPLQAAFGRVDAEAIVVINRWKVALKLRKDHPEIPIFLWLHVYPGRHNRAMGKVLKSADISVICVSKTHARSLAGFLHGSESPVISHIYNPIEDDLRPDNTVRDTNRLLFASSPHKGLAEVFAHFNDMRRIIPDLRLAVADPGYLSWDTGPVPDGVVFLGQLSHRAVVQELRRALCLFYPQTSFAETFGLVLAEANAVGTPALVQKGLGANDEILGDEGQQVDGQSPAEILARIRDWQRSPPRIHANPAFRLSNVTTAWGDILFTAIATGTPAEARQSRVMVA